jgi:hypothetical protein
VSTRNAARTRRKGVKRCHNTDSCGDLSGGLQDLVIFSSTANVKGFLEYQHSGQRNSMVITGISAFRSEKFYGDY